MQLRHVKTLITITTWELSGMLNGEQIGALRKLRSSIESLRYGDYTCRLLRSARIDFPDDVDRKKSGAVHLTLVADNGFEGESKIISTAEEICRLLGEPCHI